MCSMTRRSAAILLSDPGICELVHRHGPFGSHWGRSLTGMAFGWIGAPTALTAQQHLDFDDVSLRPPHPPIHGRLLDDVDLGTASGEEARQPKSWVIPKALLADSWGDFQSGRC